MQHTSNCPKMDLLPAKFEFTWETVFYIILLSICLKMEHLVIQGEYLVPRIGMGAHPFWAPFQEEPGCLCF